MILPTDTIVAVADGEKLSLFRNTGTEISMNLTAAPEPEVEAATASASGHHSSAANPDDKQVAEDGFAKSITEMLNQQVLTHGVTNVVVIAAPRTLGEMRKHYHKKLEDVLLREISKDLTGHSVADIEKTILAA
ncbi:MAG: host attachment protein [Tardiphaga sp.]|nr:host attachment protein [Tardiphaga sp.]